MADAVSVTARRWESRKLPQEEPQSPPAAGELPSADAQLVERLRQGDTDAGHRFFRDYYPNVYRYLLWLTGRPEAAEDLSQETFVRAWRSLPTFDDRAPLRAWLHRIAHREFLRSLRNQRSHVALDEVGEAPAACLTGWMEAVELRAIIRKLPVEEAEMLVLHYLEGYTSEEIARIVGAPAGTVRYRLSMARARLQRELGEGDLAYLNEPAVPMRQWAWLPLDQMHALEMRLAVRGVRSSVFGVRSSDPTIPNTGDRPAKTGSEASEEESMERREFLRHAAVGAAGLMLPETEKEVVDGRLTQKVTLAFKATALSDLCEHLRTDTGIHLAAGPSVADEKVTLFCEKLPLREVMRQLSRPFGYTWLRSGTPGQYRYELVQDLRSQLLEEELRNRDRNEAQLALEREMERYRPYLSLSPDEALARLKTAPTAEKPLLENLAEDGWGPIQMYFRLSHQEITAVRVGQRLTFSEEPRPGERPLPPELARGIIQCQRSYRLLRDGNRFSFASDLTDPRGLDLTAIPEVRAIVRLEISPRELGQFALMGSAGFFTTGWDQPSHGDDGPVGARSFSASGPWVEGTGAERRQGPASLTAENHRANAGIARDPSFLARIAVSPQSACRPGPGGSSPDARGAGIKVTTADVLEALYRATGTPIVGDYYTRLYPREAVSLKNVPLHEALNHLSDAMRLRWRKEGDWLQFRSMSFFNDRQKEVPNRLLGRWSAARRQNGALTLEDLVEIAQLSDSQLDAAETAEGARLCFELAEWNLGRNRSLRSHLRYLAGFTPAQRQEALSDTGLLFTRMPLAQQQQFIAMCLQEEQPLRSLGELEGAALRVDYSLPGQHEWRSPGPWWLQWVVPLAPGSEGARVLRPCVRERTRQAALERLRQIDPQIRKAVWEAAGRADPRILQAPPDEDAQIQSTRLRLSIIYIPGATNARAVHALFDNNEVFGPTR
jgi:RNA polymerase sigma-70 factor (ECF subfamily)